MGSWFLQLVQMRFPRGIAPRSIDLSVRLPRNMVPAAPGSHHWAAEASVQRSLSSVLVDGTNLLQRVRSPCCSPQVERNG